MPIPIATIRIILTGSHRQRPILTGSYNSYYIHSLLVHNINNSYKSPQCCDLCAASWKLSVNDIHHMIGALQDLMGSQELAAQVPRQCG